MSYHARYYGDKTLINCTEEEYRNEFKRSYHDMRAGLMYALEVLENEAPETTKTARRLLNQKLIVAEVQAGIMEELSCQH